MHSKKLLLFLLISLISITGFADWPSWRGAGQTGFSPDKGLISQWSINGENLIWKADFIGRSTPVVMNGRVYVIGRTGEKITMQEHIACFDAKDGKKIWEKKFNVYHSTIAFNRVGWASLVGDPETGNIYAHGVGALMICFDKDGKILWMRNMTEEYGHLSGYGGRTDTPIIDEDLVIQGFVNSGWGDQTPPRHRFYAWDKRTGELRYISTPGGAPYDFNVYSTPVVAIINGERLLIGGNADGGIYAIRARTGEKVWNFMLSKRGINSSVVVDGNTVYATHSEENLDEATMGRLVAIDATGKGDITKTGEKWRVDKLEAGYASPAIHNGTIYVVDNGANLYSINAQTGAEQWKQNLGTVGKGSPVIADGKIYATEVNGTFKILQPGTDSAKVLSSEQIKVKGTRTAEIYGSPAIAYGRIYFTTEEGLYCLGNKKARFKVEPSHVIAIPGEAPVNKDAEPASIQVVPAEVLLKPRETTQFRVRLFDAKGQYLRDIQGAWTPGNLGTIDAAGKFVAADGAHAGLLTGEAAGFKATARIRIIPDLPITEDFESYEPEKSPSTWLGANGKFFVREKDGKKVLVKTVLERGLQTSDIFIGNPSSSNYTIQADVMTGLNKRRTADVGVINSGYKLSLMGNHQKLQLLSWDAMLRINQSIPYEFKPNVWYTIKLKVDTSGEKGLLKAKVWPTGEKEPDAWSIETEDPLPIKAGSPGIYGFSNAEIYYDNIKVTKE
jgi:outer membrane protein assembly factor BamB